MEGKDGDEIILVLISDSFGGLRMLEGTVLLMDNPFITMSMVPALWPIRSTFSLTSRIMILCISHVGSGGISVTRPASLMKNN